MGFQSINPATGAPLRRYRASSPAEVSTALDRAVVAQLTWAALPVRTRARHLRALARALRRHLERLAQLATAEMGKPIMQSRAEVEKCAACCDYYARHAARYLAPEHPRGSPAGTQVLHVPMGVVLQIMPWNFPYWQVFRGGVPALAAGNVLLLKPAATVGGCALACAEVVREAGLPDGCLQTIFVDDARANALVGDGRVAGVALTGSTRAGRAVAAAAGAALKKGVYELGGSDPYLVLHDADVALAADVGARARLVNSGQSCVAAKRFLVVPAVRAEFEAALVARLAAARLGAPDDLATQLGPLARDDLRRALQSQVSRSVRRGARLLLGGRIPRGPGFFYPATVLTDVQKGMPAYHEELFGPVAAIIPVPDEETAIRVANDTPFGLGAAVFTRDRPRGLALVRDRLACGMGFVNAQVRSDSTLPFGGTRASGYGRELGHHGIREFTHPKTLWVA